MLHPTSIEFFSKIVNHYYGLPEIVRCFDVDDLLKVVLDCDELKAKILKEIVGDDMFDKLTSGAESHGLN